jgi:hypothetical protein
LIDDSEERRARRTTSPAFNSRALTTANGIDGRFPQLLRRVGEHRLRIRELRPAVED